MVVERMKLAFRRRVVECDCVNTGGRVRSGGASVWVKKHATGLLGPQCAQGVRGVDRARSADQVHAASDAVRINRSAHRLWGCTFTLELAAWAEVKMPHCSWVRSASARKRSSPFRHQQFYCRCNY